MPDSIHPNFRQPVQTVYGGAHLFKADIINKLGAIARCTINTYAPTPATLTQVFNFNNSLAENIQALVLRKLTDEPVEDFRLDFEDGYGYRSDAEEDSHALAAAEQTALALTKNSLPAFFGIRIKPLNLELKTRAIRTLNIFVTSLLNLSNGILPRNFVITLPKVDRPEQVSLLIELCSALENQHDLSPGALKIELMIETPRAIINERGQCPIPEFISAANDRCVAAHFGAFDYTASCGISAAYQDLRHPACDFARQVMLTALAGTDIRLADGVTTTLPLEIHRGKIELSEQQQAENRVAIHQAWKIHYDNVRHSFANGFYQSWDLHPAQFPARYIAVYAFFLENLSASSERLKNFIARAAQATTVGMVFDDAASGQGLLNFFLRAINCGALKPDEVEPLTGLTLDEIRSGSFAKICRDHRQ